MMSAGHLSVFEAQTEPGYQWRTVRSIIEHENHSKAFLLNDISLLKLWKPWDFTEYVRPACLPGLVL